MFDWLRWLPENASTYGADVDGVIASSSQVTGIATFAFGTDTAAGLGVVLPTQKNDVSDRLYRAPHRVFHPDHGDHLDPGRALRGQAMNNQGGTSMPAISRLGHVGLHVKDLERAKQFYRDILGLEVTDEDPGLGVVFMSARPAEEHHELALFGGRNVGADALVLQQVSFRCDTLDDVIGFYHRLREHGVEIDVTATHGNAIALYFFDPEDNRCEIYWGTGLAARQPYLEAVDLDRPKDEIIRQVEESVRKHGRTGFIDPTIIRERKVLAHTKA